MLINWLLNWVPGWWPFHSNLLVFSSQADFQLNSHSPTSYFMSLHPTELLTTLKWLLQNSTDPAYNISAWTTYNMPFFVIVQQYFNHCMCIRCCGNPFREHLTSNSQGPVDMFTGHYQAMHSNSYTWYCILTYIVETWSVKQKQRHNLLATEMHYLRRLGRITNQKWNNQNKNGNDVQHCRKQKKAIRIVWMSCEWKTTELLERLQNRTHGDRGGMADQSTQGRIGLGIACKAEN
jgi:hypothetical protein